MPTQQQWGYYERHIENLFTCSVAFRHICTCTPLCSTSVRNSRIDLYASIWMQICTRNQNVQRLLHTKYNLCIMQNPGLFRVQQRLWRSCSFVKRTRLNILRTIYILILKSTLKYLQGLKKNAGRQDISQKWFIVMKIPIQCL